MKLTLLLLFKVVCIFAIQNQLSPSFLEKETSELSPSSQNLDSWISWKDQNSRFDAKFQPLPNVFTPESPNYSEGLIMQAWWAFLSSFIMLTALIVTIIFRLKLGYCGGKQLKNEQFTKQLKWTPGTLSFISYLLFLIGGVTLLFASGQISNQANSAVKITNAHSEATYSTLSQIKEELIEISNQSHEEDSSFADIHYNLLEKSIEEAEKMQDKADNFEDDVNSLDKTRLIASFIIFCVGFVLYLIGFVAFVIKEETVALGFGISLWVMAVLTTLTYVPYIMELTGSIDYCESISECLDDSYIPLGNSGLSYYYSDLSNESKHDLTKIQAEISLSIDADLKLINSRLFNLYQINPITNSDSLRSMHELLNNDAKILQLWKILKVLENAMDDLVFFNRNYHVLNFCKDVNTKTCNDIMQNTRVGVIALSILVIAFILGAWGGFLAPRVVNRWRREEDENALAKHNLYGAWK
ncbi:unnamed protein product [Blepharisma stoltei]|uniref:Protein tweety homolog n=1 Tax=Blepharisma stoltei TaxID=1481888 RepID=A0AAU9IPQ5_9CILI|nr:unnamed protein product [Blepharisma stoltei]